MILDDLRLDEVAGGLVRSARLRWADSEFRLELVAPAQLASPRAEDASAWVPLCLLVAMRHGEDLTVDGEVSPQLLRTLDEVQDMFSIFEPSLNRVVLEAPNGVVPRTHGSHVACCISRGVDSTFAAARGRSVEGPIDLLLFVDGFDARHGEATRAGEIREAGAIADKLGLDLAVVKTNVRELTDPLFDWEDAFGVVLAGAAHALGGGVRRLVIPSSDGPHTIGPSGSNPMVDPLLSTEAVAIEHASTAYDRVRKVRWITEHRPDLLAHLKTCPREDRVDNCCQCGKCLLTMACLEVAGALDRATSFPEPLDAAHLRDAMAPYLKPRADWAEVADAIEAHPEVDPAVRDGVFELIARHSRDLMLTVPPARTSMRSHHKRALMRLVREGRMTTLTDPALGLVRVVDRRGGRHVYGAGTIPPGEVAGELGALPGVARDGDVRVWLTDEGRLVTDVYGIPAVRAGVLARARWALAPLGWRRTEGFASRARLVLRRALSTVMYEPLGAVAPQQGRRVGVLHGDGGEDRVPLYAAHHPITGDQLLSTYEWEPVDFGYREVVHLGFIEARSPLTARLGTVAIDLPWAARRGLHVRVGPPVPPR